MKLRSVTFSALLLATHVSAAGEPFKFRCQPFKVHESYKNFEQQSGTRLKEIVIEQTEDEAAKVILVQEAAIGGFGKDIEKSDVTHRGSGSKSFRASWDRNRARLEVNRTGSRKRAGGVTAEYTGSLTLKPGSGFFVSCEKL